MKRLAAISVEIQPAKKRHHHNSQNTSQPRFADREFPVILLIGGEKFLRDVWGELHVSRVCGCAGTDSPWSAPRSRGSLPGNVRERAIKFPRCSGKSTASPE